MSSHQVVFMVHKVMVEVNKVRPYSLIIREADLCSIGDVVGNGVVIDVVATGRIYRVPWMECPLD